MNDILLKRIKSFCWRGGAIAVMALLAFIAENIGDFNIPEYVVVITGLICSEITKQLNNQVHYAK